MAERRMFAKSIVLSDAFLDMPMSARCLYFTLGMLADDDGFVGNPKSIMRQCGASQDDMLVLLQKRFVLGFETGIIVIKHWRMNNYLQNDRHKTTTYIEELKTLEIDDKGAYTEKKEDVYTDCIQNVYTGKDSIDKNSIGNNIGKRFTPPTPEEVEEYVKSRGNKINAKAFYDYYTAGNWKDSKGQPVKNWKQKAITWENKRSLLHTTPDFESKQYDTKNENMTQEEIDAFYKEIYG